MSKSLRKIGKVGLQTSKKPQLISFGSKDYIEPASDCDFQNNFELNSNISVNMLPNHGYNSSYTEGVHTSKSKEKKRSRVLLDDDSQIQELRNEQIDD